MPLQPYPAPPGSSSLCIINSQRLDFILLKTKVTSKKERKSQRLGARGGGGVPCREEAQKRLGGGGSATLEDLWSSGM